MIVLTLEEAVERCRAWQQILRLQDWDVEVSIVRRSSIGHTTAIGLTTISTYRRARIRLLDPDDFTDDDWPIERDMEATLVHELVHLHLDDLHVRENHDSGRRTAENVALERAVEALARALLSLKREASVPC